jgi:hypothetical protein
VLAPDPELAARLGGVKAGQDPNESGLTGAVLAEQGMHLATPQLDARSVEGPGSAEALRDMPRLEGWG